MLNLIEILNENQPNNYICAFAEIITSKEKEASHFHFGGNKNYALLGQFSNIGGLIVMIIQLVVAKAK